MKEHSSKPRQAHMCCKHADRAANKMRMGQVVRDFTFPRWISGERSDLTHASSLTVERPNVAGHRCSVHGSQTASFWINVQSRLTARGAMETTRPNQGCATFQPQRYPPPPDASRRVRSPSRKRLTQHQFRDASRKSCTLCVATAVFDAWPRRAVDIKPGIDWPGHHPRHHRHEDRL